MGLAEHSSRRNLPELLAAYIDGELGATELAQVESWLREHPETRSELKAYQRLGRSNRALWNATAPAEPSDQAWSRVLDRIQGSLTNVKHPVGPTLRPRGARKVTRVATAIASVAVALLVVVGLAQLTRDRDGSSHASLPTDELVWRVVGDRDVEILSIMETDLDRLVVGRPPLAGPVILAGVSDVALEKVDKDTDGMLPSVQMNSGPNLPMIIAPIVGR